MTLRAALFCASLACGGPAVAEQFWEVGRFDVTGLLPDVFDPAGLQSDSGDGWTYSSFDGTAELIVFGGHDLGNIRADQEVTRQGLLARGATVDRKTAGLHSYSYAGTEADGRAYFRFTLAGFTCEGDPVLGSFLLRYDLDPDLQHAPLIDVLRDSFLIGACG